MRGFNYKKAVQALNYFAREEGGTINKMKALKLIWLSDRYSLMLYGRTITGDEYYAMPKGPVASGVRNILENSSFITDDAAFKSYIAADTSSPYSYVSCGDIVKKVFSDSDLEIIEAIHNTYSHLTQFQLSDLSHKFPEWKRHEASLKGGFLSRGKIVSDDFFLPVQDGYELFNQDETEVEVSKLIYEEYTKISSVLR